MDPRPTPRDFLDEVHARVIKLGTRERLAVERLLRRSDTFSTHGELRAALASILARDRRQYGRIVRIYDQLVLDVDREGSGDTRGDLDRSEVRWQIPQPPGLGRRWLDGVQRRKVRWMERLRQAPSSFWKAVVAGGLCLGLISAVIPFLLPDPDPLAVLPTVRYRPPPPPPPLPSEPETSFTLRLVDEGTSVTLTEGVRPPQMDPSHLAGLAVLAALTAALGLRFMRLPEEAQQLRRQALDERRQRTHEARKRMEERKAAEGGALPARYYFELFLPVSDRAVADSADQLGRLYRQERGLDLDAETTLDRTVAAGGRFIPVLEPRFSRHEILVLIDVEEGRHPWLAAFRRLLNAWRVQGIRFLCYEFHMSPDLIVDVETRESVTVEELSRRTDGMPLILFSRELDLWARDRESSWPSRLSAWPKRAWLDPNPRPRADLPRSRRFLTLRIEQLGLSRFSMTDEGILRMARHLAGDGSELAPTREPDLPPLPETQEAGGSDALAEGLRKWALAGALVPDPTWDQLEAVRRHFLEIEKALPEHRCLQLLLEWVERDSGRRAELDGGRGLAISEELQNGWLEAQRALEKSDPEQLGFEAEIHRLLDKQLGITPPENELDALRWRFKKMTHSVPLDPFKAHELVAYYDTEIAHEVARWTRAELGRHDRGTGAGFSEADLERLRHADGEVEERESRIPLRFLVLRPFSVWRFSLLAATLFGLLLWLALSALSPLLSRGFERPVTVQSTEPVATYELLEAELPESELLDLGIEWIEIPGGSFQMGSAAGGADERPVREVIIGSFQVSKTEVTVAQFRSCVNAGACEVPDIGSHCNWGEPDREDHPINCVSWIDAKAYAKWLGARLLSEAEWEYAARGGGLDRMFPWGDGEADCGRAVIGADAPGCGLAWTWSVCSKTNGNTLQGVCDMSGNVWEWVEDDWHESYLHAPDNGQAWVDSPRTSFRVFRGGSWWSAPDDARVTKRGWVVHSYRDVDMGFRLARSLPSAP